MESLIKESGGNLRTCTKTETYLRRSLNTHFILGAEYCSTVARLILFCFSFLSDFTLSYNEKSETVIPVLEKEEQLLETLVVPWPSATGHFFEGGRLTPSISGYTCC